MYAIIEESGGQRKVSQGDEILIDLLDAGASEPGRTVTFDRVLVLGSGGGGGAAQIGRPYLSGATVTAEVTDPLVMGEKIHIFKFREKKGYKRKTGHRQRYTAVKVTAING